VRRLDGPRQANGADSKPVRDARQSRRLMERLLAAVGAEFEVVIQTPVRAGFGFRDP